jgi:hypothetical protein
VPIAIYDVVRCRSRTRLDDFSRSSNTTPALRRTLSRLILVRGGYTLDGLVSMHC